jgi:hypothetical protein
MKKVETLFIKTDKDFELKAGMTIISEGILVYDVEVVSIVNKKELTDGLQYRIKGVRTIRGSQE